MPFCHPISSIVVVYDVDDSSWRHLTDWLSLGGPEKRLNFNAYAIIIFKASNVTMQSRALSSLKVRIWAPFTHSLTHSQTHSLTHSQTHSLTPFRSETCKSSTSMSSRAGELSRRFTFVSDMKDESGGRAGTFMPTLEKRIQMCNRPDEGIVTIHDELPTPKYPETRNSWHAKN